MGPGQGPLAPPPKPPLLARGALGAAANCFEGSPREDWGQGTPGVVLQGRHKAHEHKVNSSHQP